MIHTHTFSFSFFFFFVYNFFFFFYVNLLNVVDDIVILLSKVPVLLSLRVRPYHRGCLMQDFIVSQLGFIC